MSLNKGAVLARLVIEGVLLKLAVILTNDCADSASQRFVWILPQNTSLAYPEAEASQKAIFRIGKPTSEAVSSRQKNHRHLQIHTAVRGAVGYHQAP